MKTIFKIFLPMILFLIMLIIRDSILNFHYNNLLFKTTTLLVFPTVLLMFFYKIKFVKYLITIAILSNIIKIIMMTLNNMEVVVSFNTVSIIVVMEWIVISSYILLIFISFFKMDKPILKLIIFFILILSILNIPPLYSEIHNILFGNLVYSQLPTINKVIFQTISILDFAMVPLLIYILLILNDKQSKKII